MSIKLSDAAHLAIQNIVSYKLRSLAIVLTVSIIFGLIIGINFLFAGLRTTLLDTSTVKTAGASYVVARFQNAADSDSREERLAERAKRYHGEDIGTITDYKVGITPGFSVANYSLFESYVDQAKLASLPPDRLPILLRPLEQAEIVGDDFKELLATEYYVVGELSKSTGSIPPLPGGYNLLNLPIKALASYGSWQPHHCVILDVGDGRVNRFIESELIKSDDFSTNNKIESYSLIRFANTADLTSFLDTSDTKERRSGREDPLIAMSLFSNTAGIVQSFFDTDRILFIAETILMVVAVIITAFTFIHLIDQERSSVALYRSLGATTRDLLLTYLLYLLGLCLISIFVSIVIGIILVAAMSSTNASILATSLQSTYGLSFTPHVFLLGIDHRFFIIIFCTLFTAPLALLLSQDRLSSKHLASSMKDK